MCYRFKAKFSRGYANYLPGYTCFSTSWVVGAGSCVKRAFNFVAIVDLLDRVEVYMSTLKRVD